MSNYLVQNKLSKDELERVENRLRNVLLPNPTVQQINDMILIMDVKQMKK